MNNKILIIEDDEMLRESTADLLTEEGYTIYQAENGLEGIKKALETMPDIILCDIAMPNFNGYKVYTTLQENGSTSMIPFIFLTAKTEKKDIRAGMQLGADDYITKPFDYHDLLATITTRLEKHKKYLNFQRKNLDPVLENDVVGVYLLKKSTLVFYNKKFAQMLGYSDKELQSLRIHDIIHRDDREKLKSAFRECENGIAKKVNLSFKILHADNKFIEVDNSGSLIDIDNEKFFLGMLNPKKNNQSENSEREMITGSEEALNKSVSLIIDNKDLINREMLRELRETFHGSPKQEKYYENPDNLTKREIEVLRLICKGMTNEQIADNLFISKRTVDTHRSNLLDKTLSKNTAQLIIYAIKKGMIELENMER